MRIAREVPEAQTYQAYRRLARKYHPDVSRERDGEARFKDVGEAYEVLKDPKRRAAYDQLGQGPQAGEEFRLPPDWGGGFNFGDASDGFGLGGYSDFFESQFGRASLVYGEDRHARVLLDLDASLQGGSQTLTVRLPDSRERTLNVQIPNGILAGQHVRLAGQGTRIPGSARNADLFIEVEYPPHRLYRIDDRDLTMPLPVAPWEAMLGATIKVATPGGPVDLKIPAGSRAGSKLRLKGRGMPSSPPGDFCVVREIALPDAADAKARTGVRAFAAACPFNPRAQLGA